MSENAAPGQQQTGYRRYTAMMLLPNYSIVEKMKELSKSNQTKKDQIFHCMTQKWDQLRRANPHLLSGTAFSLSVEPCVVFSSRSDALVLGERPSWGTAEKKPPSWCFVNKWQLEKKASFPVWRDLNYPLLIQEDCEEKAALGSCSLKRWSISLSMSWTM